MSDLKNVLDYVVCLEDYAQAREAYRELLVNSQGTTWERGLSFDESVKVREDRKASAQEKCKSAREKVAALVDEHREKAGK